MGVTITVKPPFTSSAADRDAQKFLAGLELKHTGTDPEGKSSGYFLFDRAGSDEPSSAYQQTLKALETSGIEHQSRDGGSVRRLFVEGGAYAKLRAAIAATREPEAKAAPRAPEPVTP